MYKPQKNKTSSLISRVELGVPLNKSEFHSTCSKSGALSLKENFLEKDLGNGYIELVPKKKKG